MGRRVALPAERHSPRRKAPLSAIGPWPASADCHVRSFSENIHNSGNGASAQGTRLWAVATTPLRCASESSESATSLAPLSIRPPVGLPRSMALPRRFVRQGSLRCSRKAWDIRRCSTRPRSQDRARARVGRSQVLRTEAFSSSSNYLDHLDHLASNVMNPGAPGLWRRLCYEVSRSPQVSHMPGHHRPVRPRRSNSAGLARLGLGERPNPIELSIREPQGTANGVFDRCSLAPALDAQARLTCP